MHSVVDLTEQEPKLTSRAQSEESIVAMALVSTREGEDKLG
jgi:hypothetical protein